MYNDISSLTHVMCVGGREEEQLVIQELYICMSVGKVLDGEEDKCPLSQYLFSGGSRGGSMGSMEPPFLQEYRIAKSFAD